MELDNLTWEDVGACKGLGPDCLIDDENPTAAVPDFFFEAYETSEAVAQAVDQLCMTCPVQLHCFKDGVFNKQEGVRGGVYLDTTGKADRTRNRHKTSAVWSEIEGVVGKVRR